LVRIDILLEVQEVAEGQVESDLLRDPGSPVVDLDRFYAEGLRDMCQRRPARHLECSEHPAGGRRVSGAVERAPHLQGGLCGSAKGSRSLHLGFVDVIPHYPVRSISSLWGPPTPGASNKPVFSPAALRHTIAYSH